MKYVGLDLHKKNIFATVLDGEGKILSKANIGSKREDISHYLKRQGNRNDLSVAMEATITGITTIRILESLTDNITARSPSKDKNNW